METERAIRSQCLQHQLQYAATMSTTSGLGLCSCSGRTPSSSPSASSGQAHWECADTGSAWTQSGPCTEPEATDGNTAAAKRGALSSTLQRCTWKDSCSTPTLCSSQHPSTICSTSTLPETPIQSPGHCRLNSRGKKQNPEKPGRPFSSSICDRVPSIPSQTSPNLTNLHEVLPLVGCLQSRGQTPA